MTISELTFPEGPSYTINCKKDICNFVGGAKISRPIRREEIEIPLKAFKSKVLGVKNLCANCKQTWLGHRCRYFCPPRTRHALYKHAVVRTYKLELLTATAMFSVEMAPPHPHPDLLQKRKLDCGCSPMTLVLQSKMNDACNLSVIFSYL